MPQNDKMGNLVKSVPTARTEEVQKLVKGNAKHQIYSTDHYIFSITSSFETLYRYKYHGVKGANEVDEILAFKRVRPADPQMSALYAKKQTPKNGVPKAYLGVKYDLYSLTDQYLRGYMLVPRKKHGIFTESSSDSIYFAFDKKVR